MSRTKLYTLGLALALGAVAACTDDEPAAPAPESRIAAPGDRPLAHAGRGDRDRAGPGDRPFHDRGFRGDPDGWRAQMEARRAEMLAKFDADKDGTLSDAERAAAHQARVGELLARLDADGNGALSEAEWQAGPGGRRHAPAFATVDANHDGALSLDELTAMKPPGRPHGPPPGGPDGDGPPPDEPPPE